MSSDFLILILFIWQLVLSYLLIYQSSKWRRILKEGKKINLVQILENIIAKEDKLSKKITTLEDEATASKLAQTSYFQKFSLTRFNPFENTGGDQSFIVTLLNGQNDGIILTSLHSRTGTRIYAKQITAGRASANQFSKEEKEVIENTLKNKNLKS